MAASSGSGNPNANQNPQHNAAYTAQTTVENSTDTSTAAAVPSITNNHDAQASQQSLKHDTGIVLDWSAEEQSILEDGLSKYNCEPTIKKYIKIAALLPEKTVRDVAFRCRWISKKENGKRRKAEEQNMAKKGKEKKDKPVDSTVKVGAQVSRSTMPVYTATTLPIENDDGIPNEAIGGPTGQLLEQNYQVIGQIKANLAAYKLQENTDLLARFRDNIYAILSSIRDVPGIISQMPPLPVDLNNDLADTLLPKPIPQTSTSMPT